MLVHKMYRLAKVDIKLSHDHSKDVAGCTRAEALLVQVPKRLTQPAFQTKQLSALRAFSKPCECSSMQRKCSADPRIFLVWFASAWGTKHSRDCLKLGCARPFQDWLKRRAAELACQKTPKQLHSFCVMSSQPYGLLLPCEGFSVKAARQLSH